MPKRPETSTSTGWTPAPGEPGNGGTPRVSAGPDGAPVDDAAVTRVWPRVLDRVRNASRVTAMYLQHGRPGRLEGSMLMIDFPADARFQAEALTKEDRQQHVADALAALLGQSLRPAFAVQDERGAPPAPAVPQTSTRTPAVRPAPTASEPAAASTPIRAVPEEPPPPDEPLIDPEHDEGQRLDADADARAVADLAARALDGEVLERPDK